VLAKLFCFEGGRSLLHWTTLGEERKALLKIITEHNFVPGSYLAGDTALALILGHRQSIDFDWFCADPFDSETLARQLSDIASFQINEAAKGTLHGIFKGVRITWLHYPNPMLEDYVLTEDIPALKLVSLKDIGVMKLIALSHRGSAKDFVDLFELAKNGYKLDQLIDSLPNKFPRAELNYYHIIKSLSYFDDAECEPPPKMLANLDWQVLKDYFLEEQRRLLDKYKP
jgi:hypothetical protein